MKFGKEFTTHLEETLPEWRDKYLNYKPLKKLLKHLPSVQISGDNFPVAGEIPPPPPPPELQEWFVRILNEELDKFNDFYVDKEEEFIIRFQELRERIERVKEKSGKDVLAADSESSDEMMRIRKDFVAIHGEMVLLKNYSSLNFAGLVKILKKFDKRTGGLLRLPFTQLAFDQPFFTTEPLTRLVRECEANLDLLFPLEAEVVESDAKAEDLTGGSSSYASNVSPTLSLGVDNVDIYRSTLAAMKAIQGLKKASSTYNPLSFSYIFGNQENDTGAVTAENSSSEQLVASQNDDETVQEVSNSPK